MYTASKFIAHGEHKLKLQGNIILCKAVGAWNLEQAQRFVSEISGLVQENFSGVKQKWIRIMNMSEWELSTPDARDYVADYIRWEQTQNCIRRYYCYCNKVQKRLLYMKYKNIGSLMLSHNIDQSVLDSQQLLAQVK